MKQSETEFKTIVAGTYDWREYKTDIKQANSIKQRSVDRKSLDLTTGTKHLKKLQISIVLPSIM